VIEAAGRGRALGRMATRSRHPAIDVARRVVKSPVGAAATIVLMALVVIAIFSDQLSPHDAFATSVDTFQAPSLSHPFGTDDIGRDQMARVFRGARISLTVAFTATLLGTLGGAIVGISSGYAGGWFDLVVQRIVDAVLAIPGLVLALFFVAVFGPGIRNGLIAITIIIIPAVSRVIRGATLTVKQNVYVEAARAVGAGPTRIMFNHILPNVMAPILILASTLLGAAIIIEAGLAFLGLGASPPTPSWGLMLSGPGRRFMEEAPWLTIFPAGAISLTVLAFNLFGDVIRDTLDPRLRGSR
jgi:peptide/nickel transport system permease protein